MKIILNLEEWAVCALCIFLFSNLPFVWWWFPALLLLPDIGILGYLVSPKIGAWTYNLLHHRGIAALVAAYAVWSDKPNWKLAAIILFAHISMDRALGYGLKHETGFSHTHLGVIGKPQNEQ
ncbi:MAG: DUF4260 domain-containing protein [Saprospiraceae bacterium]